MSLFLADKHARQSVLAAARLPSDCGELVLKYISYFSPAQRFLTADRAAKLLTECCDMILNGVSFDRQHIQAPSRIWAQAFEIMAACELQLPIKNHHYLLRIVQRESTKKWEKTMADIPEDAKPTPRMASSSHKALQKVADVIKETPPKADPLAALDTNERAEAILAARQHLLNEGFSEQWLAVPLVEQKAREMLE